MESGPRLIAGGFFLFVVPGGRLQRGDRRQARAPDGARECPPGCSRAIAPGIDRARRRERARQRARRSAAASAPCAAVVALGDLGQAVEPLGAAEGVGALEEREQSTRRRARRRPRASSRSRMASARERRGNRSGAFTRAASARRVLGRCVQHQQRVAHRQRRSRAPRRGRGARRGARARSGRGERGVELGQHARERAALAQHREHARRALLHQAARELLPDALGHERVGLARLDHARASAPASRAPPRSRSAPRSARRAGCAPDPRRTPRSRGAGCPPRGRAAPPWGSMSAPSSPRAIALMVRSRRSQVLLERHVGRGVEA